MNVIITIYECQLFISRRYLFYMNESNIMGISIRAIIVLVLIILFATAMFLGIKNEVLNSMTLAGIGWYFGQKNMATPTEPPK